MRTIKCDTCGKEADLRKVRCGYEYGGRGGGDWQVRYDQRGRPVDLCGPCVGPWDATADKLRWLARAKAAKE